MAPANRSEMVGEFKTVDREVMVKGVEVNKRGKFSERGWGVLIGMYGQQKFILILAGFLPKIGTTPTYPTSVKALHQQLYAIKFNPARALKFFIHADSTFPRCQRNRETELGNSETL